MQIMCGSMEEMLEEAFQRGIDQSRVENIKNIMESLNLTAQQAMDVLKIPTADQPKYLAKI